MVFFALGESEGKLSLQVSKLALQVDSLDCIDGPRQALPPAVALALRYALTYFFRIVSWYRGAGRRCCIKFRRPLHYIFYVT